MRLNALTAVLVVNLAVAAALVWLWSDADRSRWAEPEPLPPSLEDVAATSTAETGDVSRYRETLERPLFASTRRIAPRRDPGAEAQEAVDSLKDVRLLGTYGAGTRGGVIVVRGGKVERVALGASIGGWKVAGEEGRGAALMRGDGERRKLELALNAVPPAATAAASKAGEQDAAQASASDQARPSAAAQGQASRRAAAGRPSGQSDEAREALNRQRIERMNARRARKGLPPITQ